MKADNKDEIKMVSIREDIESRKENVKEMISCLNEWKDSDEIRKMLLKQIRKANFDIALLETKLKVMDVTKGFRNKVTNMMAN